MDIDKLYINHRLQLKHSLVLGLLGTCVAIEICLFISLIITVEDIGSYPAVAHVCLTAACLAVTFFLLALSLIEPLFNRLHVIIAIATVLCGVSMVTIGNMSIDTPTPVDGVPVVYSVILMVYMVLPLPRWLIIVLGAGVGVGHVLLVGIRTRLVATHLSEQLVANSIMYVCANLVGFYHLFLTDQTHRHTFNDTRNYIQARMKLEHEKLQQEHLLLSVLPVHLAVEMKNKMLDKLSDDKGLHRKRSAYSKFHDLYVKVNENVSILYADIVNFTPLSSDCTAAELVRMLNELFGKFDKLAQENDCLRIKILGDCYYCVSGLPVSRPGHAKNCVVMGLEMIEAISEVRQATGVDVDMRIGVHTGSVLSGVLGLRKWQYDVWSDDVILANHMESCGEPGRVHISKVTLNHLDNAYDVQRVPDKLLDDFIREKGVETYWVVPKPSSQHSKCESVDAMPMEVTQKATLRISKYLASWGADRPFAHLIEAGNMANQIGETSVAMMEANLASMFCSCDIRTWCSEVDDISRVTLQLRQADLEQQWRKHPDHNVKFFVVCADVFLLCLCAVELLTMPRSIPVIVCFVISIVLFSGLTVMCLLQHIPHCGIFEKACGPCISISSVFTESFIARIALYVLFMVIVIVLSTIPVMSCDSEDQSASDGSDNCILSEYMTCIAVLVLTGCTLFRDISYLLKCVMMLLCLVVSSVLTHVYAADGHPHDTEIEGSETVRYSYVVSSVAVGTWCLAFLFVIFHIVDRQNEYTSKIAFVWRHKFVSEKEETETMGSLNKVLLENILPAHVAEHYLYSPRRQEDLYHETYESICVMFASISNFWDFSRQTTISKHGIECLRLLNQIIGDFDQLLSKPKFSSVEKIKTIGSTYMAATGLQKAKHKRKDSQDPSRWEHNILVMTDFALAMMSTLESLNDNSFNQFKLRIGLNHGPAVAGVIGAHKPLYDIWGDTVNIASRMDSCGVVEAIQLPEKTAKVLLDAGYKCKRRGEIKVKGKHVPIVTYLLTKSTTSLRC